MSKFQKRNVFDDLKSKKEEEEKRMQEEQETMTPLDRFIHSAYLWFQNNRKQTYLSILGISVMILAFVLVMEWRQYREEKSTEKLESILLKPDSEGNIEIWSSFLEKEASGKVQLRAKRHLAKAYLKNNDFEKAAIQLEEVAQDIEEPILVKAIYYWLAGQMRELSNNWEKSAQDYEYASKLITNSSEAPLLYSNALYSLARAKVELGQKKQALENLEKVLSIDSGDKGYQLNRVREKSLFLLFKLKKEDQG
jgi:tetratricopeptide (TPR) repeat protein